MVTHDLAFAYEPHNSAIIFGRSCGGLAMLEAGPNDALWVRNLDMLPHLKEYLEDKGPVWISASERLPLNADQSEAALPPSPNAPKRQEIALGRLGLQLTPIRARLARSAPNGSANPRATAALLLLGIELPNHRWFPHPAAATRIYHAAR
ncbi:MAG: hypothetical protein U0744_15080 [Gemmataceae bacterium]